MVHPYTPVLTMALSIAYKVFGYKLWVMQVFSWSAALVNSALIFLITKKVTKKDAFGLLAVTFYVLTQPFLEGNMLWPDTAIVTPILIGTYLLLDKRFLWSGLFLAIGALVKQTAGVFLVIGALWLVLSSKKSKKLADFSIGPVLLGGALFVRLLTENALAGFLNWTLAYPSKYWTSFPGYVQMNLSDGQFVKLAILLIPLIVLLIRLIGKLSKDKSLLLLLLFFTSSLVIVYPRFSFFHLQTALAFTAILFGGLLNAVKVPISRLAVYFLIILVFISYPAIKIDWGKQARFYSQIDFEISGMIPEAETVYLLGFPSSYYVFSNTLPPKPWLDNFGWYWEVPGVQAQTISSWFKNPPETIVWQEPEPGNWYDLGTYQPEELTQWIKRNYTREGEIDSEITIWKKNL